MCAANKTRWVRLGNYIELCDERNSQGAYGPSDVKGMTITKEIIPTKADVKNTELSKFLLVNPKEFVYNPRTHGKKIGLGFNQSEKPFIISWNNIAFRVKDMSVLLPDYLYMIICREEWDRNACFRSWGSSTEVFSWTEFCLMTIPLPPIEVQRELVDTYEGLKNLAEQNEALVASLSKICEALVIEAGKNYSHVTLGNYISQLGEKNDSNFYVVNDIQGVTSSGQFDETRANTTGIDFSKYKVVHPNNFAYNPSRINLGSIAIRRGKSCIVSPMYVVFQVTSDKLLPEYLNCSLSRKEFLRSTLFYAMGSVRDTFDYSLMEEAKIPLPPIEVQQSIVNLYHCMEEAKKIATTAREQLKTICPALVLKGANS